LIKTQNFSISLQSKETLKIRENKKKLKWEKQRNSENKEQTRKMSELAFKEWCK